MAMLSPLELLFCGLGVYLRNFTSEVSKKGVGKSHLHVRSFKDPMLDLSKDKSEETSLNFTLHVEHDFAFPLSLQHVCQMQCSSLDLYKRGIVCYGGYAKGV